MLGAWVLVVILHSSEGRLVPMEMHLDSVPNPAVYCEAARTRLESNQNVALSFCVDETAPPTVKQVQR